MRKFTFLFLIAVFCLFLGTGFQNVLGVRKANGVESGSGEGESREHAGFREEDGPTEGGGTLSTGENDNDRVWTFAVMSDLNSEYGSTSYHSYVHRAVEWVREEGKPDLVISAGDLVAGQKKGLDYGGMWRSFHEVVTDPLAEAGIAFAVTPGNHDASGASEFWRERIHFAREWKARKPDLSFVDDRFYPFYYAFEVGPALFISLDATMVGPIDALQRAWVRETLAANQHKSVKVVFGHLPLFGVSQGREREILNDRGLESMLEEFEVDMMISGHHHAYYPARRGQTVYLHAGALGNGPRALIGEEHRNVQSLAVVRFDARGIREIESREAPEYSNLVALETLPESVEAMGERIWRVDLYERLIGVSE